MPVQQTRKARSAPERPAARSRKAKPRHSRRGFAARLFMGVFLLLLSCFLLGYAAPYLPPEAFWWTALFASGLPYLAGATLLLTMLIWAIYRGKWYVPLVIVLVLVGIRYIAFSRFAPEVAPSGDDLVVMTYNAPVRGPNPDTLSQVTLRLVEQVRPDILALQEPVIWTQNGVRDPEATAHLQAIIDSLDYWAPTPKTGNERVQSLAQPVVARFPMGEPDQYAFSLDEGQTRPTYITRIPFTWQGRNAVLYNVHLYTTGENKPWLNPEERFSLQAWIAFVKRYRDAYVRRAFEARQLRILIRQETLPFIVAGDFNSTIHHWELHHIARGLTDTFTARGEGWGATYHMKLPLFRIDHILVSRQWEVVKAYVPATETLSDHRPVVAQIRLGE